MVNTKAYPLRTLGARADAIDRLIKLLPTAKYMRPSEREETQISAEQARDLLWDMVPHTKEIADILKRGNA